MTATNENLSAKGGYRLKPREGDRKVILMATGSEVEIAMTVAERLEEQGIGADVVSMVSTDRFDEQGCILSRGHIARRVEQGNPACCDRGGTTVGWERYTGLHGLRSGSTALARRPRHQ